MKAVRLVRSIRESTIQVKCWLKLVGCGRFCIPSFNQMYADLYINKFHASY